MAGELVVQNGLIVKGNITATGSIGGGGTWTYKGGWDASGGTLPAAPDAGDYYDVTVAGAVGPLYFNIGDFVRYNGTLMAWQYFGSVQALNTLCAALGALCASQVDFTANCATSWASSAPAEVAAALNRIANDLAAHTGAAIGA